MSSKLFKLSLGYSPCPNDTFIFDALVNGKIDTEGYSFQPVLEDVETLNRWSKESKLDITKLSFYALFKAKDRYELLPSGSAMGRGVGPLLISAPDRMDLSQIRSVAIPGKNTTAYLLFRIFFPELKNVKEMIFSDIEEAVLRGDADAGLIIHESRFTYSSRGLKKIADLGELWEKATGNPIPLGGIAIRKDLPQEVKDKVGQLIKKSVEFAFSHPDSSADYVSKHAQEMDPLVRQKHIELYVNRFSIDLGEEGKAAIDFLFKQAAQIPD